MLPRRRPRSLHALLVALLLAAPDLARAGTVIGATECEKCHKPALKKWRVEEPAQFGAKAHFNTNKQLADPKAAKFAAAIGLANPADPKGRCADCHATVVRGTLRTGVSCETCHGAASAWNPVHDKEPLAASYQKSLPLGLRDLHAKPAAIAKVCVDCHVTPEKALAAAGHPDGRTFNVGEGLKKLVHWTAAFTADGAEHARYDFAQVQAAASPLIQKALAAGGGKPSVQPPSGPPPTAPKPPSSAPVTAASARPTVAPSARPVSAAPPEPWDWDQPLPELPADYPTEASPTEPTPAPTAAPPARRRSLVVDQPTIPTPELLPAPEPEKPEKPAKATLAAAPRRSAVAEVSARRGQALERLRALIESGRRAPGLPAPKPPREFQGPDGELLYLQEIAFYYALETLRSRP